GAGQASLTAHHVILLRERSGDRRLPIWVGAPEGNALALHLGSELPLRPLTIDLAARLLEATGGCVDHVAVSRLHEKTFYATIAITAAAGTNDVDARPSDALNLAVRVGVPIYVDDEVFESSSFRSGDVGAVLDAEREEPADGGEWRSVSASDVKALMRPHARP